MAVLFLSACTVAQTAGDSIIGRWHTEKRQAMFDFYRCNHEYRARMYPLEKPDLLDTNNQVDSLKMRKLIGITTVHGLTYDSKGKRWVNGKVYNPENGKTYSCNCVVSEKGTLLFRGFLGLSVLGQTQTWTRVTDSTTRK
jgi:uncharacterized protein (DUF2147 family)